MLFVFSKLILILITAGFAHLFNVLIYLFRKNVLSLLLFLTRFSGGRSFHGLCLQYKMFGVIAEIV